MRKFVFAATLALVASPALAQETPVAAAGAAPEEAPICTDRPTRSNFACTVPEGKFQIESDLFNWARTNLPGGQVDTFLYTSPVVKYGVGPNTDLEVNWTPYVETRVRAGGAVGRLGGVGDVVLRVKQRFTNPDKPVQVAAIPYVKAPTARLGIGNGKWEGGLIVPVNISIPKGWTLTIVPQVDIVADVANPRARHAQYQQVVNLGKALTDRLTLYGELWTAQNFDPSGTIDQYSADFAFAYLVQPTLQLDIGGNFGLNQNTPDVQLYLGVSKRF